jgi:hypothetical protein
LGPPAQSGTLAIAVREGPEDRAAPERHKTFDVSLRCAADTVSLWHESTQLPPSCYAGGLHGRPFQSLSLCCWIQTEYQPDLANPTLCQVIYTFNGSISGSQRPRAVLRRIGPLLNGLQARPNDCLVFRRLVRSESRKAKGRAPQGNKRFVRLGSWVSRPRPSPHPQPAPRSQAGAGGGGRRRCRRGGRRAAAAAHALVRRMARARRPFLATAPPARAAPATRGRGCRRRQRRRRLGGLLLPLRRRRRRLRRARRLRSRRR